MQFGIPLVVVFRSAVREPAQKKCVALGNKKFRGLCFNLYTEIHRNTRPDSSGDISDLYLGANSFEFQPGYQRR